MGKLPGSSTSGLVRLPSPCLPTADRVRFGRTLPQSLIGEGGRMVGYRSRTPAARARIVLWEASSGSVYVLSAESRGFIRFRVGFGREALCQSYHAPVVTLAVTGGSGDRGVKEGRQATLKTHSEEGAEARVGARVVGALPSTRRESAGTLRRAPPLTPRHGPSGRYAARSAGRAGAASRSCRGPAGDQEPPGRH